MCISCLLLFQKY